MEILSLNLRLFVLILAVWITTCQDSEDSLADGIGMSLHISMMDADDKSMNKPISRTEADAIRMRLKISTMDADDESMNMPISRTEADETRMTVPIITTDDPKSSCECNPSCPNGGTRVDTADGTCVCAEGYTGATCETDCLRQHDINGLQYTGTVSKTRSGRTCQRWDKHNPHNHMLKPADFSGGIHTLSEAQNFCRNPSTITQSLNHPWCYTTDGNRTWEYCEIPFCKGCRSDMRGSNYTGTVSTTNDGDSCLDGTYCRTITPSSIQRPWCETRRGRKYCDRNIPFCHGCLVNGTGSFYSYLGTLNTTKSGLSCQRWDQQTPHNHTVQNIYNAMGPDSHLNLTDNFCRNVGLRGKTEPWCYTMSNDTEWEYCDAPMCLYEVLV